MARILLELSGNITVDDLCRFAAAAKGTQEALGQPSDHPVCVEDDPNDPVGPNVYVIIDTDGE